MPRLPPAAKLSLVARRNVRDEWESKKADFEQRLSDTLGAPWTVEVDALAIAPYARDDWAKISLGAIVASYVDGAIYQLDGFAASQGAAGVAELNGIAHARVLTVDVDEAGAEAYCGCAVQPGGRLAILFNENNFGVNVAAALEPEKLLRALNDAPPAPGDDGDGDGTVPGAAKLSYAARASIRNGYDPHIAPVRERIAKLLGRDDVRLVPGFEDAFARLSSAAAQKPPPSSSGSAVDADGYGRRLGPYVLAYFEGVAYHLDSQQFGTDEMLREGFGEAVETGVIAFRVVDALRYASYCEVVVEDGALYVQTTVAHYGVNINDAAQKLIEQL